MFQSIEVHDYRGFKHYRLPRLARVNLLVGRNSSGKTSLLEAIRLLATGGDPRVLIDIARHRGEVALVGGEPESRRRAAYPVLSHFFHGHDFREGARFRLTADEARRGLVVEVASYDVSRRQRELFDEEGRLRSLLAVRVEGGAHPLAQQPLPVTEDGVLSLREYPHSVSAGPDQDKLAPVQFIAPDSLEPSSMSDMWNRVILEGREREVTQALQILEPGVTDVVFLSGQPSLRYLRHASILVALRGSKRRVPLGSLGDGMRRLLALSLGLVQSERGVLLVDEIDTGLHYSVMGDMWRLVVEAAIRSDVQVFATTHSYDCVNGLAWLCRSFPHLAREVAVQKIDPNRFEAVTLGAERIVMAVEKGLEMR